MLTKNSNYSVELNDQSNHSLSMSIGFTSRVPVLRKLLKDVFC